MTQLGWEDMRMQRLNEREKKILVFHLRVKQRMSEAKKSGESCEHILFMSLGKQLFKNGKGWF